MPGAARRVVLWAERRVVAFMQQRLGPNRVGPFGLLQSLMDGIKLMLKEDLVPAAADMPVYVLAPIIAAVPALMAFSVIPFGPVVSIAGYKTPLQLTCTPVPAAPCWRPERCPHCPRAARSAAPPGEPRSWWC